MPLNDLDSIIVLADADTAASIAADTADNTGADTAASIAADTADNTGADTYTNPRIALDLNEQRANEVNWRNLFIQLDNARGDVPASALVRQNFRGVLFHFPYSYQKGVPYFPDPAGPDSPSISDLTFYHVNESREMLEACCGNDVDSYAREVEYESEIEWFSFLQKIERLDPGDRDALRHHFYAKGGDADRAANGILTDTSSSSNSEDDFSRSDYMLENESGPNSPSATASGNTLVGRLTRG